MKKGNVLIIKGDASMKDLQEALRSRGWEVLSIHAHEPVADEFLPDLIIIAGPTGAHDSLHLELTGRYPGIPVFLFASPPCRPGQKKQEMAQSYFAIPCIHEDLGKMAETMLYAYLRGGRPLVAHEGVIHHERALEVLYEINSPLSVILANANLLLADEKNLPPQARSLIKEIRLAVDAIVAKTGEFGDRKSHLAPVIPSKKQVKAKEKKEKPRILVVDDEKSVCTLFSRVLEDEFDVSVARDGREAMKLFEEESFDLFIIDLHLPHIKGLDLIKAFRKSQKAPRPFLVITGFLDDEDAIDALKHGAHGCFYKPFDIDEIRAFVRQILK